MFVLGSVVDALGVAEYVVGGCSLGGGGDRTSPVVCIQVRRVEYL